MDAPTGWISETDLRAAMGTTEEDRKSFHRNLVNWRENGLLPRFYDGHKVPFVRPLPLPPGNEAWHPPITVEMVRRINELRQRSKNMDKWLWQLWLEGFPIEIVDWCRLRLIKWQPIVNKGVEELSNEATRKPGKRSDPRRSFYRRLIGRPWMAIMTWALHVAMGARPPESIHDPVSPPRSALAKILSTEPSVISGGLEGSQIEGISVSNLMAVLNEDIGADELHKVREDCFVLSHAYKVPTILGKVLAAMWGWVSCRAMLLPALLILHRSPDHQDSLLDWVKRNLNSPSLLQFEIPHARR